MDINKIAIIGAGTMGSGIAQIVAVAGINVTLRDIKNDLIDKGIKTIINCKLLIYKKKLNTFIV